MAIVTINQGESIESALRRFKRKVMTEEIIKDAKKHAFFIPPGQKAKLKSALARKRNKKKGRMRTSPPRTSDQFCARSSLVLPPLVRVNLYSLAFQQQWISEIGGANAGAEEGRLG